MTGISPDWQSTRVRRTVGEAICIVEQARGAGWDWGVWLPRLSTLSAGGREHTLEQACAAAEQAAKEVTRER